MQSHRVRVDRFVDSATRPSANGSKGRSYAHVALHCDDPVVRNPLCYPQPTFARVSGCVVLGARLKNPPSREATLQAIANAKPINPDAKPPRLLRNHRNQLFQAHRIAAATMEWCRVNAEFLECVGRELDDDRWTDIARMLGELSDKLKRIA